MRFRLVLPSICLCFAAFMAEATGQTLGRPPAPAARLHDMSYGTWTDLPDAWGYFPPSGIMDRQRMLFQAEHLRQQAIRLEHGMAARHRGPGRSDEIEAVRALRFEAEALRLELLSGSHMAFLRPRLQALAAAFEAAVIRDSADPRVKKWLETGSKEFGEIATYSGPWPRTPLSASRGGRGSRGSEPGVIQSDNLRLSIHSPLRP